MTRRADSAPRGRWGLVGAVLGTLLIGAGVVMAIGGVVALLGLGLAFGWLTNPPWPVRVVSALVLALAEWASP